MEIQVPAANIAFEPLKLGHLRDTLIRLEDSIVFALIERAQFKRNDKIYLPRAFEFPGDPGISFLEYMLKETEKVHAKVRRYTSPDEHPFSPIESLPSPILPEVFYPKTIISNGNAISPEFLLLKFNSFSCFRYKS